MENRLLVICGPTATGKTSLAIKLAKKFDGELVSADSRQVYKGMDIGTGKDLPVNSKLKFQNSKLGGYYEINGTRVWGYDLISPKEDFSVSQYTRVAKRIINDIWARGKLPILVGGTGFYIKSVVYGIPTSRIPRNINLRKSLEDKSIEELFEILAQVDPVKAGSLNASDKKNPRRLIRAIEIAQWKLDSGSTKIDKGLKGGKFKILFIGLTAPREVLYKKIDERVDARLASGMESEVKKLLGEGVPTDSQAFVSLGYRQMADFLTGKVSYEDAVRTWKQEEKNYAKRQMTWFKKDKRINWFDIISPKYEKKVESLVKKWYIST